MAAAPMVSLHVTLLDKGQSSAVGGCASLDTCVWTLGEQVGMQKLTSSAQSNFGYIFRSASGMWKSSQFPNLTLAEAGVRNTGDKVQFAGDFDVVTATKTSAPATPSTAPSSPPTIPAQPPLVPTFSTYSSSLVELKVTIDAVSKSLTKICRASLDKCVWDFGQDVGTAMLSSPVSHGFVFSYAGHHWRSRQHPNLTLAEAGVRKSGEAVAFSADVRPLSPAEASPAVELTVRLLDKSGTRSTTGQAPLDMCVWTFGAELGMRKLTTGPLSNYGYVFRCGSSEWRSNRNPNLTLADAGVADGDAVDFLGDFEPPSSAGPIPLVEVQVTLVSKDKKETSTHKTTLDKGVWRFGEEQAGVRNLLTSSLSRFGYVFHFGEHAWRKGHHPNLTLADAGVKDGDVVEFTGDFESL